MDTAKSSVRVNPKPINVFYVWYTELCRRSNCTPAPAVKPAKPKCQTVLEFFADRLKVEEWNPIIGALKHDTSLHVISIKGRINNCQFLHDVDTEEKAKNMKRRFGSLWTAYVLQQLLKSISNSLKHTQVLTCLELDGLPMFTGYIEPLLLALKKNRSLKTLSFSNSPIGDHGCELICAHLRYIPNVEIINLSGCGLTSKSGEQLAKLIKYQQINRYCESWHNSLRYEDPHMANMRGLRRIMINCNPDFSDAGFEPILEEMQDDLWIKALDLQKCGLTENISQKLIDTIHYSRSLEIVDVRHNPDLSMETIEKVLQLLRDRHQQLGNHSEYQWCTTAATIMWNSISDSVSRFSLVPNSVHKSRSAPMRSLTSKLSSHQPVRKSKTVDNIKNGVTQDNEKKLLELNTKLKMEVQRRKEIEKCNEELKQKLEQIQNSIKIPNGHNKKTKVVVSEANARSRLSKMSKKIDERKSVENYKKISQSVNGHTNGFSSKIIDGAYKIFETLLNKEAPAEETDSDDLNCEVTTRGRLCTTTGSVSDSDVSLYTYMEEIKNSNYSQTLSSGSKCAAKNGVKKKQKR
ncbi:unnamed protein product [Acanthoscelides obtectus]|uniref:Centrosomal protein of 78 kDa n=1 Tax=Acanthoscelides obtectus TaxID=200917 RepID=A0A9P0NYF1_ACAOB|nr:unnamed protein product [Acanthoscelides obtectus]CAK1653059.1 Protein Cep78 homolog [Acanthoscelides obtectus]